MPLNAKEPIPSKLINSQGVEIEFPSRKQLDQTKNFQNDARQEMVDCDMSQYKSTVDFKQRFENSNYNERSKFSI